MFSKLFRFSSIVEEEYARKYSESININFKRDFYFNALIEFVSSIKDKKVLDLCGGAGHWTKKFASLGAKVTYLDNSESYKKISEEKNKSYNVEFIICDMNRMLDHKYVKKRNYDLVFNFVSWLYCKNDYKFAAQIIDITKPGGFGFIVVNNELFLRRYLLGGNKAKKFVLLFLFYLNEICGLKLKPIHPSHRRLVNVFIKHDFEDLRFIKHKGNTIVMFKKNPL